MSIEKHDLVHELPEYREKIHNLKMNNAHFARLFEQYHQVDHAVHRVESGAEVTSDEYLEGLKKKRLMLKDRLYAMLKKA
ncbi:MAG: YdcH family protein [Gammaproteobacteria bacterium]|nr:YdcH family protein [Gammaproteobacteria bacterium]